MCICILPACIHVCETQCMSDAHQGQKIALESLKLECCMTVGHHVDVGHWTRILGKSKMYP